LTQGPRVKQFEEAFAEYVGAKYAVAVANGTAALHLCAMALNVNPGDKVITTPITFAASANCVSYCGGEVIFADIDPETYLLDIHEVRKLLEKDSKRDIKGIIPVDFAGRSVDMEAYRQLADEFDCWIIEDACHAPGAFFKNSMGEQIKAGSGKYADLAIFSFHPVKHIAAGEGGMITTNNEELYNKLLELRTHGITKDSSKFKNPIELALGDLPIANSQKPMANSQWPGWYMEMQSLGYNYRISDINCALGLSQLKRAEEGLIKRYQIAARYYEAFKDIPQITDRNYESTIPPSLRYGRASSQPAFTPLRTGNQPIAKSQSPIANRHAHHLYVIEVENRLGLYNYLREQNIYCQIHYFPCHLMPYYQQFGWKYGDFPKSESYYAHCLSIPMYPSLTDEQQDFVIDTINEFLDK
jgi:hypothetical protein